MLGRLKGCSFLSVKLRHLFLSLFFTNTKDQEISCIKIRQKNLTKIINQKMSQGTPPSLIKKHYRENSVFKVKYLIQIQRRLFVDFLWIYSRFLEYLKLFEVITVFHRHISLFWIFFRTFKTFFQIKHASLRGRRPYGYKKKLQSKKVSVFSIEFQMQKETISFTLPNLKF